MIQAEFKREQDRSYLIFKTDNKENYQVRMMEENEIKGLLPFKVRSFNGEDYFYYDITSRQTLANLYSVKEMEKQDLKSFFLSMEEVMEEMDRYLMDRSGLYAHPDYCFRRPGEGKTEWIFIPGNEEGILALAEFFMERVNHRDSSATEIVYRFYSEVKDGNFCLSEFVRAFSESSNEREPEQIHLPDDNLQWKEPLEEKADIERNKKMTEASNEKQDKIWDRIRGRIFRKKNSDAFEKDYMAERRYWGNEAMRTDCLEYNDEEEMHETTVLNRDNEVRGCLRPMSAKLRGKILNLEHFPCVIGNYPECADVILNYSSISRMHARISKIEQEFYIEDLNSRNGTKVNGFPLGLSEKVRIRPGDEVAFADLIYVFE